MRSGMYLIKWFSISDDEQRFRFQCRIEDPMKMIRHAASVGGAKALHLASLRKQR